MKPNHKTNLKTYYVWWREQDERWTHRAQSYQHVAQELEAWMNNTYYGEFKITESHEYEALGYQVYISDIKEIHPYGMFMILSEEIYYKYDLPNKKERNFYSEVFRKGV